MYMSVISYAYLKNNNCFTQDKNPFSGFSEEHLSKLDEFLSSEEAKKILQQTSEGDFNTMSELAGSSGGMQAGGDLKLDLFDVSCHCVIIGGGGLLQHHV